MKELQLTVKQIKYMEIMNELVQVEQKLSESPPEATLLKVMRRKAMINVKTKRDMAIALISTLILVIIMQ